MLQSAIVKLDSKKMVIKYNRNGIDNVILMLSLNYAQKTSFGPCFFRNNEFYDNPYNIDSRHGHDGSV